VNSIDPRTLLFRALGGGGAIALMIWLSEISGVPLMWIPFSTSIVLVMGSPDAPPARLRCLVGGHVICATCGILCTLLLGFDTWVAAIAIGCSIAVMHLLDAFHPPAGISPIIIASTHATPLFMLSPVLAGVAILAAYACLFHRATGERWPKGWL
jgi:CBS-domain-containing membrane protein